MNEFSKYELQSLLWAIMYVRDRTNNCGDIMRVLRTKIQSMIDNYCGDVNYSKCPNCDLSIHPSDTHCITLNSTKNE